MRKLLLATVVVLVLAAPAAAVAPTLSVTSQDRRPQATFAAPFADFASIYFATSPDRATDGQFFTENVETLDTLADDELATGRWISETKLDPGTYYVMLRASADFDRCYIFDTGGLDPACADGFSNVVTLTVPKPAARYSAGAQVYQSLGVIHANLRATPLGEKRAYRVCYRTAANRQRCTRGTIEGFGWDSSATDTLRLSTRLMPARTTLTWWVGVRKIATKTVRVR